MKVTNNIKIWSSLGMRATFGLIAIELAKKYPDLIITTSDVSTSAGLDRFKNKFPDQYIDVGIAEQNLIGVSTGLSSEGFKVISTTFAPFQTLRCCEQIKVNLGYMKHKICMVGLASGLVLGNLGFTHCSIEDIGVLRSIPNLTIISPSDCLETAKAVEASIKHHESVYIRLTGGANNPIVNFEDYKFMDSLPVFGGIYDNSNFCSENIEARLFNIGVWLSEEVPLILFACSKSFSAFSRSPRLLKIKLRLAIL